MLMLGKEGLERVAENAVLNANYIKEKLKPYYDLPLSAALQARMCLQRIPAEANTAFTRWILPKA